MSPRDFCHKLWQNLDRNIAIFNFGDRLSPKWRAFSDWLQICHSLWQKVTRAIDLEQASHIPHVTRRKAAHLRKGPAQVSRYHFNHRLAPAEHMLFFYDGSPT